MSGQFKFHPVGSDPKSYHTASAAGTDCSVRSNNDVGIALTVPYLAFGKNKCFRIAYVATLQHLLDLPQFLRWRNLYSKALWCQRKQDCLGFHLQRLGL